VFVERLRFIILGAVAALCLAACQKPADPETPPVDSPTTQNQQQPQGGGGGGIAPVGPNVGGITPVVGGENVGGGGGGGVGQAAKDMAKRTAAGAGAPAGMGQAGTDMSGE
jgi:hypothetical protein